MKKVQIILIILVAMLSGCSVKDEPKPETPPVDVPEQKDNYLEFSLNDIHIESERVVLNVNMKVAIDTEYILYAYQDGIPVDFSLDKKEKVDSTQRLTTKQEETEVNLYIKAASFDSGETVNFGVGFVSEPDYFPEVMEFTRFDVAKQAIVVASKDYVAEKAYKNNEMKYKVLKGLDWKSIHSEGILDMISPYAIDGEIDVLEKMAQNELVNDGAVIHAKSGSDLSMAIMKKGKAAKNGYISFYIDHKPVVINENYTAAYLNYMDDTFGITTINLQLPDNLDKGYHTLYAIIFQDQSSTVLYDFYSTQQRVLNIE